MYTHVSVAMWNYFFKSSFHNLQLRNACKKEIEEKHTVTHLRIKFLLQLRFYAKNQENAYDFFYN